jgi:hypothetical protein
VQRSRSRSVENFAGKSMRVETRSIDTIRNDSNHCYVCTEDGRSFEQLIVEEVLALVWSQDGAVSRLVYLFRPCRKRERKWLPLTRLSGMQAG